MAATIWDTTRTNSNITLSGGSLVATIPTTGSTDEATYGTNSQNASKWVFSVVFNTLGAHGVNVGLGTSTASFANTYFLGKDAQSLGYFSNTGTLKINNAAITTVATYAQGNTVWLAVDITNKLVWVRVNNGNWNNNAANNPDTGTGGASIAGLGSFTLFPAVSLWTVSDQVTADFTSQPSGLATFTNWNNVSSAGTAPALSVGKVHTIFNSTEITLQMPGLSTSQAILTDGLPFGTVELSQASGTAISSVQVQQSNDNVTWVNQGSALSVPALQDIYTGTSPSKFVRFLVNGGDTTSVVNIMLELMGTRG